MTNTIKQVHEAAWVSEHSAVYNSLLTSVKLTSSQHFSFWLANVDIDGKMVPLKAISTRYYQKYKKSFDTGRSK